jgi:hypothetical protein
MAKGDLKMTQMIGLMKSVTQDILDLVLSAINVSDQTLEIVKGLPKLEFD